jgi:hypothetical protein
MRYRACRSVCPLAGLDYVVCRRGDHRDGHHSAAFAADIKGARYATVYIHWHDRQRVEKAPR